MTRFHTVPARRAPGGPSHVPTGRAPGVPPAPPALAPALAPALPSALALVLILAVALAGCGAAGNRYEMRVEAKASTMAHGRSYVILPGITEARATDPLFQEVAKAMDAVLAAKGYEKAPDVDHADLGLYVAYSVEEMKESTGTPSDYGPFPPGGTQPAPGFGPGAYGFGPMPIPFVSDYMRTLSVEAVDFVRYRANDPRHVVWRIQIKSRGPSNSLEKALPFFSTVLSKYMGENADLLIQVDANGDAQPVAIPKPSRSRHAP
uniref:DUF4136 domain-containing protein n=1 Tax=Fundidesulfovibrio putealis TaxID=270496 RepID=A0A7C4AIA9_9BACT